MRPWCYQHSNVLFVDWLKIELFEKYFLDPVIEFLNLKLLKLSFRSMAGAWLLAWLAKMNCFVDWKSRVDYVREFHTEASSTIIFVTPSSLKHKNSLVRNGADQTSRARSTHSALGVLVMTIICNYYRVHTFWIVKTLHPTRMTSFPRQSDLRFKGNGIFIPSRRSHQEHSPCFLSNAFLFSEFVQIFFCAVPHCYRENIRYFFSVFLISFNSFIKYFFLVK